MAADRVRVLIVDDDPMSRELIEEFLDEREFETVSCEDGLAAWELLKQHPHSFDVVLLDRMMPRMNGLELLRRIKKDQELTHLPVIMETAAADHTDIRQGIDAGAFYYLTKPLEASMLATMVRAAASDYERFRELQQEVRKGVGVLGLMQTGVFRFTTPEEAMDLGSFLAQAYPDPERVVLGLSELLVNAVEHGNLEISYEEKTELNTHHRWHEEVRRRLGSREYAGRFATVSIRRSGDQIDISIQDQGRGFDPRPYLQIDPSRVFDTHGRGIAIANLLSFDTMEYRQQGTQVVASVALAPPRRRERV